MLERAPRLDFNLHPQKIPSLLSNSHTERDWTHLFLVQLFTWFAIFNVLWILYGETLFLIHMFISMSTIWRNLKIFTQCTKKCYFKWFSFGLHMSAHTRRRKLTSVAFLAPAFEARRMHRWVGAALPHCLLGGWTHLAISGGRPSPSLLTIEDPHLILLTGK